MILQGIIKKLNHLSGAIRKSQPDTSGEIHRIPSYSAEIKPRGIVWRFLDAVSEIFTASFVKAKTTLGIGLQTSDRKIQMEQSATAEPHTAKTAESKTIAKNRLLANFQSYRRAPLINTKNISMVRMSGLVSAAGKLLSTIRIAVTQAKAFSISVSCNLLHRHARQRDRTSTLANNVPTVDTMAQRGISVACGVDVSPVPISRYGIDTGAVTDNDTAISLAMPADFSANVGLPMAHKAFMSSAYYPELIDGVLIIRKVYAATQNGEILEVE